MLISYSLVVTSFPRKIFINLNLDHFIIYHSGVLLCYITDNTSVIFQLNIINCSWLQICLWITTDVPSLGISRKQFYVASCLCLLVQNSIWFWDVKLIPSITDHVGPDQGCGSGHSPISPFSNNSPCIILHSSNQGLPWPLDPNCNDRENNVPIWNPTFSVNFIFKEQHREGCKLVSKDNTTS